MMRRMLFPGLAVVAIIALTVVASAFARQAAPASDKRTKVVRISTRALPRLGTVLVDSKGLTLYMFVPDKRKRVTCKGTCAAVWPPVKLPKGAKPVAGGKATQRLLGSDPNPAGGRVVTYHGWPLYTYVADKLLGRRRVRRST